MFEWVCKGKSVIPDLIMLIFFFHMKQQITKYMSRDIVCIFEVTYMITIISYIIIYIATI